MRVNKYLTPLPLGGLGWALSFRQGLSLPLGGVGEGFRCVILCEIE